MNEFTEIELFTILVGKLEKWTNQDIDEDIEAMQYPERAYEVARQEVSEFLELIRNCAKPDYKGPLKTPSELAREAKQRDKEKTNKLFEELQIKIKEALGQPEIGFPDIIWNRDGDPHSAMILEGSPYSPANEDLRKDYLARGRFYLSDTDEEISEKVRQYQTALWERYHEALETFQDRYTHDTRRLAVLAAMK